ADRQLLRRRSPALRPDRRQSLRAIRRRLLLVAGDGGPPARRAARSSPVLADLRRVQSGVLPPALSRGDGDAAPHLYVSDRRGLDRRQLRLHRRRVRHRGGRAALHRQRLAKPSSRGAGARGSVGWTHAGVADVVAAAGARLRHDPARLWTRLLLAREARPPSRRAANGEPRAAPRARALALAG